MTPGTFVLFPGTEMINDARYFRTIPRHMDSGYDGK